jgi:hypothetical protein
VSAPEPTLTVVPYGPNALDGEACAQLISSVLWLAIYDASMGERDALAWLAGPHSRYWAGLLDIDEWPPSAEAMARVRAERDTKRRDPPRGVEP